MRRITSAAIAAILGTTALAAIPPAPASAGVYVGVSVNFAPPPLPVYDQPPIPGPGYIWTPGYWAWGDDDYYWVPGTWVLAPEPGLLWTPAWWGWDDGVYLFHAGYWGPTVGFYGGINYGFGYTGFGYGGGYWDHDRFFYNRTVNNITNVNITNVYNKTVINNTNVTRVSYNGGTGGVNARPTATELAAARSWRVPPTGVQVQHQQEAARLPIMRAAANRGAPPVAATARPAVFNAPGQVTAARGSPFAHASAGAPAPGYGARANGGNSDSRYGSSYRGQPAPQAPNAYAKSAPSAYEQARTPSYQASSPYRQAPAYRQAQPNYGYGYSENGARSAPQRQSDYRQPEYRQPSPPPRAAEAYGWNGGRGSAYAAPAYRPPAQAYAQRPPQAESYRAPAYAQRPAAESYRQPAYAAPRGEAPRSEPRPQGREDQRKPPQR
ncbi:YXWGXW repeat-containing protein [Phenylobacterium montanum]|uniref:YXWGXW repeat-containing protein n=1 Tax=Phenylobacterium montanum TaxID=2823693 RepID=A0A975G2D5_9CAUL|nr:YXWGXW repeat-containing protein [Caulobacter sp. S6]QUD89232.1 YXWGXW repeat-containing protein [Caulobacter sp. S6]